MNYYTLEDLENLINKTEEALKSNFDRVSKLRLNTMEKLLTTPRVHLEAEDPEYPLHLIVLYKKIEQIMKAETADDLKLILKPPSVHYNGAEVIPANKWVLPEEELIMWSNVSLMAPLNKEGLNRYMKLFKEIFPEGAKEIFKN